MVVGFWPSCLSISQQPHSKQTTFRRNAIEDIKRPPMVASREDLGLRVFVISDLHTDYSENLSWVKCLSTSTHKNDVLLVAGDVAERYNNFVLTMSLLKERFQRVFYVPGNHDLWCRWKGDDFVRTQNFVLSNQITPAICCIRLIL